MPEATSNSTNLPHSKPIILNAGEVRELLDRGEVEVRRSVKPGPVALQHQWNAGDRFWVREPFAARGDGATVRVRYVGDHGQGDARVILIEQTDRRFATKRYRTWPAKYCPRWASRLVVKLVEVREEAAGDRREAVLRVKVVPAGDHGGKT